MIEKMSMVLPVDDLQAAVHLWQALLDVAPTFVDASRWAQFDVAGMRLALAGTDRTSDGLAIMARVGDLDATRARLTGLGHAPGPIEQGPHERRFTLAQTGTADVTYYQPS